jgi:hypothetical protein
MANVQWASSQPDQVRSDVNVYMSQSEQLNFNHIKQEMGQGSSHDGGILEASTVLIFEDMIHEISVDPRHGN